jgi:hypothetical protein
MATWLTTSSMAAAATGRGREGEEGCQRQAEIGMGSGGRRVERSGEGRRRPGRWAQPTIIFSAPHRPRAPPRTERALYYENKKKERQPYPSPAPAQRSK